jgi:hypothetical protein
MCAAHTDVDLGSFTRDLAPQPPSVWDLSEHLFTGNFRQAGIDALHLTTGSRGAVRGLGFEVTGVDRLDLQGQAQVSLACDERPDAGLSSLERLKRAAIRTKLELDPPRTGESEDQRLVKYLKEIAEPGDIVLVSCDGKSQKFFTEVWDNVYRQLYKKECGESLCPFTHALVVTAEKNLLHINFRGVSERSWERLFLYRPIIESVALVRPNIPAAERLKMAEEAKRMSVNRTYNYWWGLVNGPILLLAEKIGLHLPDRSAEAQKAICVDFISEPAKTLAASGVAISKELQTAVTPRDLFAAKGASIIAAGAFRRE